MQVTELSDHMPMLGEMSSQAKEKWEKKLNHSKQPLGLLGMDIGYGNGTSPGGVKYTLMLMDDATKQVWIYRLHNTSEYNRMSTIW